MTTLEPVWKPALTSGAPFADDNPAGLAFVLDRLEPGELASRQRSGPVSTRWCTRPGIDAGAAARGARRARRRATAPRWRGAPRRRRSVDGVPGGGAAAGDLLRLLADLPTRRISRPSVRRWSAWRARAQRRRAAGRVRSRCCASMRSADAVCLGDDRARRRGCAPTCCAPRPRAGPGPHRRPRAPCCRGCATASSRHARSRQPSRRVTGRYVRLVRPGGPRAEPHRGAGVQRRRERRDEGHGDPVEHARRRRHRRARGARHRRRSRAGPAGRHRSAQGHGPFTSAEQDPGGSSTSAPSVPIDTIALWAAGRRHADRAAREHPRWQRASRSSSSDACALQAPTNAVDVGGDLDVPLADGGDRRCARHARPRSGHGAAARDARDASRRAPGGAGRAAAACPPRRGRRRRCRPWPARCCVDLAAHPGGAADRAGRRRDVRLRARARRAPA